MTTITGAQFRNFYHHHWPKGWYVEDMPYHIEDEQGTLIVAADAQVDLSDCGYAVWEGGTEGAHLCTPGYPKAHVPMDTFYARVMEIAPTEALLTVKGSPQAIAALRAQAEAAGLVILS